MTRLMVYCAGPYISSPTHGTRAAIDAAEVLYAAGYLPFIPHTDLLWDMVYPHDVDFWYALTEEYVPRCDILLRLPGASKGADRELQIAKDNGMPYFEGQASEFVAIYGKEREHNEVEIKPVIRQRRER